MRQCTFIILPMSHSYTPGAICWPLLNLCWSAAWVCFLLLALYHIEKRGANINSSSKEKVMSRILKLTVLLTVFVLLPLFSVSSQDDDSDRARREKKRIKI